MCPTWARQRTFCLGFCSRCNFCADGSKNANKTQRISTPRSTPLKKKTFPTCFPGKLSCILCYDASAWAFPGPLDGAEYGTGPICLWNNCPFSGTFVENSKTHPGCRGGELSVISEWGKNSHSINNHVIGSLRGIIELNNNNQALK